MSSPTARTLAYLREQGYIAEVVERFNTHTCRRIDLAGCIDAVAFAAPGGIIGVQATSGTNHAARRKKSMAEPRLRTWLGAGGQFWIVSWTKRGNAGKRKVWVPRVENVTLADLDGGK